MEYTATGINPILGGQRYDQLPGDTGSIALGFSNKTLPNPAGVQGTLRQM